MSAQAAGTKVARPTTWYIARDGKQHGPLTDAEFRALAQLGHLREGDLLWHDGAPGWFPAAQYLRTAETPAPPKPIVPPELPAKAQPELAGEPQPEPAIDMRVFLSFHTPDIAHAESLKAAIEAKQRGALIFFAPTSLRAGQFWMPQLGDSIAAADAFLLLVGERLGPYQTIEYYQALERRTRNPGFPLVPVLIADNAPGLPFIDLIHLIKSREPHADPDLTRIITALEGNAIEESKLWRSINPYRGLESLREEDSAFFFGREADTAAVLNALAVHANTAITLVGNSGVGKSSLVEAGIFAALKRRQWPGGGSWPSALKDSRQWALLSIRPGADPVRALISAFADLWFAQSADAERLKQRNDWYELVMAGKAGIGDLLDVTQTRFKELSVEPPTRVVLNINQSEELYSLTHEALRQPFSQLVADGLKDPRLAVLASIRSDQYGALQNNRILFDVSTRIDVAPLDHEGLKQIITGPTELLGARFESDELPDFIVKDASGQAGALPLLAFYLTDLWARMQARGDGVLRLADTKQVVDLTRSLAAHADRFLAEHPDDVEDVKRLFVLKLSLVQEDCKAVRRRVERMALSPSEDRLVEALSGKDWRLLVTGNESLAGAAYVEVAHDVMLEKWPTFAGWVDEERADLLTRTELERAMTAWRLAPEEVKKETLLRGWTLDKCVRLMAAKRSYLDDKQAQFVMDSARNKFLGASFLRKYVLPFTYIGLYVLLSFPALMLFFAISSAVEQFYKITVLNNPLAMYFALFLVIPAFVIPFAVNFIIREFRYIAVSRPPNPNRRKTFATGKHMAYFLIPPLLLAAGAFGPRFIPGTNSAVDYEQKKQAAERASDKGEYDEAIKHFLDGARIAARLAAQGTDPPRWLQNEAEMYESAADVQTRGVDTDEAIKNYQKAIELRNIVLKKFPNNVEHRKLMMAHKALAETFEGLPDAEQAMRNYREARRYSASFADLYPSELYWHAEVALIDFAMSKLDANKEVHYRNALSVMQRFLASNEEASKARAQALESSCFYRLFVRDFDKALEECTQATAIDKELKIAAVRRAHALMFLGRGAEARAIYLEHKDAVHAVRQDFEDFRGRDVTMPDMEEIEQLLEQHDPK